MGGYPSAKRTAVHISSKTAELQYSNHIFYQAKYDTQEDINFRETAPK